MKPSDPERRDASATVDGRPTVQAVVGIVLLTLIYGLNMGNRFMVATLTQPMESAFALDDATVGLLTQVVSSLFYILSSIPFGILADRRSRVWIVSSTCALFSLMTVIGAFASNTWVLGLSRVGVGIGAGGTVPAAVSLVADLVPARARAMAMTLWSLGVSIGAVLGTWGVGLIADRAGWRIAMAAFGLAGLVVAALMRLLVREPEREKVIQPMRASDRERIAATLTYIGRHPALLQLLAGAAVVTAWSWGIILWLPTCFERSWGLTASQITEILAPIHLVGGVAMTLITASIMRKLARNSVVSQLLFVSSAVAIATIASFFVFMPVPRWVVTGLLWIYIPVAYLYTGPVFALVSHLSPSALRGQVTAIMTLVTTAANLVILPPLLGFASDFIALHTEEPTDSLRIALSVFSLIGLWGALHLGLAARYARCDA